MNITKQICLAALVCVTVLGLKGEEKMPRRQTRTTTNASQTETAVEGTGNLSKKRREELIGKINEIRAFLEQSGDTNATRLITFAAELEKEVRQKKYGLVFEEHKERVDIELENNLPVLTENKSRFIDKGGELNFLIEGDNLAALKLLEKTHKGKIDLIYIDPPYNTGNKDFVYNDSYVEKEDTFRHSKWLSFMRRRLEIAKRLLSERGIIFFSIDDNEQATLKLLCDDVFGDNYVATLPTIMNLKGNQDQFGFAGTHEYTLVYVKNKSKAVFNQFSIDDDESEEWNMDEYGYYKQGANLKSTGVNAPRAKRPNLFFPLYITKDNRCLIDRESKTDVEIFPRTGGEDMSWRWSKEKFINEAQNVIVVRNDDGKVSIYKKQRPAVGDLPSKKPKSLFYKAEYSSGNGTAMLKEIFGAKVFSNPKPLQLIEDLVSIGSTTNSIILDFFAGSGTTGHAVMKLNAEDGGKRKFILVTNNENDICEKVTYERLKRVIDKEGYKARLKYFKIDYVPIARKVYFEYADELLKHIRELVELENAIDFSKDETIAIAVTDKEFEKFVASEKKMTGKRAVYVGHDVLIGAKARKVLQGKGIEIRIIPEYYYAEQEG